MIEYDEKALGNSCCIYFSNHGIYYPETQQVFESKIIKENAYEWYRLRVPGVKKHIFLRDIRKQFYVEGINNTLNSIDKLVEWLKTETKNYFIVTVGSSAGGYAAAIVGTLLGADKIYCFSAQFSLYDDFAYKTKELLLKHENDIEFNKYYNILSYIEENKPNIIYMYPALNRSDRIQASGVGEKIECVFPIKSNKHGVPLYRHCIIPFLRLNYQEINSLCIKIGGEVTPFVMSIYLVGIFGTIGGIVKETIILSWKMLKKYGII